MPRLFFALYPEKNVRDQFIPIINNNTQGKAVKANNLHMTLYFVGQTEAQRCLITKASQIQIHSFTLIINQYGYFKRAKVFWAGPSTYPEELSRLAQHCACASTRCGMNSGEYRFTPHITLARKVRYPSSFPEFKPIEWTVNDFCLMESRSELNGVRYEVVKRFPISS